jgi:hypothetical protein
MGNRRQELENRRIIVLAWSNAAWQVGFAINWLWVGPLVDARWGEQVGVLVQGVACVAPTLVVAIIMLRWMRRIGIWD